MTSCPPPADWSTGTLVGLVLGIVVGVLLTAQVVRILNKSKR